jgi:hypothetical protein
VSFLDDLAKLLFPTPSNLHPEYLVVSIDGVPCKLAALFNLFFEELLIERHGTYPDKQKAVHPEDGLLADLGITESRSPKKPQQDDQIL